MAWRTARRMNESTRSRLLLPPIEDLQGELAQHFFETLVVAPDRSDRQRHFHKLAEIGPRGVVAILDGFGDEVTHRQPALAARRTNWNIVPRPQPLDRPLPPPLPPVGASGGGFWR